MLHGTLACDPDGLPLGLLEQRFIDRPELDRSAEADEKESRRWAEVVEALSGLDLGEARAVHVMDREGDAYAVFRRAADLGEAVLVRAQHDRAINEERPSEESSPGDRPGSYV